MTGTSFLDGFSAVQATSLSQNSDSDDDTVLMLGHVPPSGFLTGVAATSFGDAPLGRMPPSGYTPGVASGSYGDAPLEDQVRSPFGDNRPPPILEESDLRVPKGRVNLPAHAMNAEVARKRSNRMERSRAHVARKAAANLQGPDASWY